MLSTFGGVSRKHESEREEWGQRKKALPTVRMGKTLPRRRQGGAGVVDTDRPLVLRNPGGRNMEH